MAALDKIRRSIMARLPGTAANIAAEKRQLERELRAQGYSRAHATAVASASFRKND